jgi:hypothetical protein
MKKFIATTLTLLGFLTPAAYADVKPARSPFKQVSGQILQRNNSATTNLVNALDVDLGVDAVALSLSANASQTVNILEVNDSGDTLVLSISSSGDLVISGVQVDYEAGASEGYPRLAQSTTPPAAACDSAGEAGRLYFDSDLDTDGSVMVCTGAGGWKDIDDDGGVGGHGDGANCAAGEIALGVDANGAVQGCYEPAFTDVTGSVTDAQVPNTITIDLAATATALAANGGNCSAGQWAAGVDASGAAEGCTADDDQPDSDGEVPDNITVSAGTVTNSALTLVQSATPTPTAEGRVEWDTDDNRIVVGDGAGQAVFYSGAPHGNGANCSAGEIALGVDANGAVEGCYVPAFSDLSGAATDAQIPNNITIDLAATATALAANGANCSAGNYPLGVDESGAAESCTADDDTPDSDAEVPDAITVSAGTVTNSALTLVQSTTPTPTAEGRVEWDTDGDLLVIGDGTGQAIFHPGAHTPGHGNGANCSAGNYPLGVDASGAVESCTAVPVVPTFISETPTGSGTSWTLSQTPTASTAVTCSLAGYVLTRVGATPADNEFTVSGTSVTLGLSANAGDDVICSYTY